MWPDQQAIGIAGGAKAWTGSFFFKPALTLFPVIDANL